MGHYRNPSHPRLFSSFPSHHNDREPAYRGTGSCPPPPPTPAMDCQMSMIPDDGDLSWPDNQSMGSEDNSSRIMMPQSPIWTSNATARMTTGQLSPISTEFEVPLNCHANGTSEIPTMIHSASSSCADSWSTSFSQNSEAEDADHDVHWEQDSDDILTVPKAEPTEDEEFHMEDVKEAPRTTPVPESRAAPTLQTKAKRPRGRPRKHPLTPQVAVSKIAKGRSKTGTRFSLQPTCLFSDC